MGVVSQWEWFVVGVACVPLNDGRGLFCGRGLGCPLTMEAASMGVALCGRGLCCGRGYGRGLTRDVDLLGRGRPDLQLQAAPALRVVHAAQRGHAAHTAPVHVHLAA